MKLFEFMVWLSNKSNLDSQEELAKKYPNAHKAVRSYEVIQETGDVIFVPSKWHHQVHNLEDTISINHNWFNGANIGSIFGDLKKGISMYFIFYLNRFSLKGWVNPLSRQTAGQCGKSFTHPLTENFTTKLACHFLFSPRCCWTRDCRLQGGIHWSRVGGRLPKAPSCQSWHEHRWISSIAGIHRREEEEGIEWRNCDILRRQRTLP